MAATMHFKSSRFFVSPCMSVILNSATKYMLTTIIQSARGQTRQWMDYSKDPKWQHMLLHHSCYTVLITILMLQSIVHCTVAVLL